MTTATAENVEQIAEQQQQQPMDADNRPELAQNDEGRGGTEVWRGGGGVLWNQMDSKSMHIHSIVEMNKGVCKQFTTKESSDQIN